MVSSFGKLFSGLFYILVCRGVEMGVSRQQHRLACKMQPCGFANIWSYVLCCPRLAWRTRRSCRSGQPKGNISTPQHRPKAHFGWIKRVGFFSFEALSYNPHSASR